MFKSAKSCSLNTKLGFHFGVNFQKTVFWNLSRVALLISVAGETLTQALNISSNFIKKVLKSLASLGTTIFFFISQMAKLFWAIYSKLQLQFFKGRPQASKKPFPLGIRKEVDSSCLVRLLTSFQELIVAVMPPNMGPGSRPPSYVIQATGMPKSELDKLYS